MLPVDVVACPCAGPAFTIKRMARMAAKNVEKTVLRMDPKLMLPPLPPNGGRCGLKEAGQTPATSQDHSRPIAASRPAPTPIGALYRPNRARLQNNFPDLT